MMFQIKIEAYHLEASLRSLSITRTVAPFYPVRLKLIFPVEIQ